MSKAREKATWDLLTSIWRHPSNKWLQKNFREIKIVSVQVHLQESLALSTYLKSPSRNPLWTVLSSHNSKFLPCLTGISTKFFSKRDYYLHHMNHRHLSWYRLLSVSPKISLSLHLITQCPTIIVYCLFLIYLSFLDCFVSLLTRQTTEELM